MNSQMLIVAGLAFGLLLALSSVWMLRESRRQQRFQARVMMIHGVVQSQRKTIGASELRHGIVRLMSAVGQSILRSGILPARTLSELETTLVSSGLRGSQGMGVFIGAKLILLVGLPLVAWLATSDLPLSPLVGRLIPAMAALAGLMLPDRVIAAKRKRYLRRLEAGIPDTLDMMVICTQAGLGLSPSILRVATELRMAYPEAAAELERTATEMQLLSDSRVAISQLGTRTGLEALKRLSATMIQSLQYGTPLSDALRTLSAELRQQMLNRCESRAAKLPVMMTLPTIAFILPCVFLVAGGPAIIQLMKAFSH